MPPPANKPLWSSSQLCLYGQNEKKLGGGGKRVEAMREVQKSTTQMGSLAGGEDVKRKSSISIKMVKYEMIVNALP